LAPAAHFTVEVPFFTTVEIPVATFATEGAGEGPLILLGVVGYDNEEAGTALCGKAEREITLASPTTFGDIMAAEAWIIGDWAGFTEIVFIPSEE